MNALKTEKRNLGGREHHRERENEDKNITEDVWKTHREAYYFVILHINAYYISMCVLIFFEWNYTTWGVNVTLGQWAI